MVSRRIGIVMPVLIVVLSTAAATADRQPRATPEGQAAKASPRAERRVPFAVGEQLLYDVSWSNYVTAGTLALRVESKKASYASTAYYVTAEAQTTGVVARLYTLYYKADTLIDAFTLLPQRGSLYSRESRRERLKITTFDHSRKTALFEMKTASHMRKDLQLPPLTQDMLSAIYVLRSIQPRPGDRLEMPISDSGWLYRVAFVVGAPESVQKADGSAVSALRVTPRITDEAGKPVSSNTVLWLSHDAALKPVRMEAALTVGRIVMAMR